jgi:hypothetical protein
VREVRAVKIGLVGAFVVLALLAAGLLMTAVSPTAGIEGTGGAVAGIQGTGK